MDCTFADVPRELLEQKNKELLLEKASTFALFDKSVSVESCKTSNKIVRSYLGLTGVGPMVGIDKKIRRALDLVQPDADQIDSYVAETELFSEAVSKAASLSYAAGLDFDSVNNFEKGNDDRNPNSNLEQARIAIQEAAVSLDKIVAMLVVPWWREVATKAYNNSCWSLVMGPLQAKWLEMGVQCKKLTLQCRFTLTPSSKHNSFHTYHPAVKCRQVLFFWRRIHMSVKELV